MAGLRFWRFVFTWWLSLFGYAPSAAISFSAALGVVEKDKNEASHGLSNSYDRTLQASKCTCEDGPNTEDEVTTIRMLAPGGPGHNNDVVTERFRGRAPAFLERTGVKVEVIGLGEISDLNEEIIADAEANVYDGYVLIPGITGELMEKNGLADLTGFVASNEDIAWTDILSFVRNNQAVYNGDVRTIPCDGDVLSLYYRKDLFDQYNLTAPRTWDEYAERAEFFHGMEVPAGDGSNTTVTLAGSCIARAEPCEALPFFNNLVLAATTQSKGTSSGAFFDPVTFEPLFGEAMAETLRHLENQAKFGAYNGRWKTHVLCLASSHPKLAYVLELNHDGSCPWPIAQLSQGTCAMTYSWGNEFTQHLQSGSILEGKLGIASTPGVTKVLDRSTGKLVQCTEETCPFGKTYQDLGRVNYAPYAAAGGWSGGVAGGVGSKRQQVMAEFLGFVCGKEESLKDTVPNARGSLFTGTDPYRKSHFDNLDEWVDQGYPLDATIQYQETILDELGSPNAVLDVRFPNAYEFMASMHYAINRHLVESTKRDMTHEDRLATSKSLEAEWKGIIAEYDRNKPVTADPLMIAYQKSVNSYIPPSSTSQPLSVQKVAAIVAGFSIFISLGIGLIIYFISLRRIEEAKRLAEIRAAQRRKEEYEDDESSLNFEDHSNDERDEVNEIEKLISSETKTVRFWRALFLIGFAAFGFGATVATYDFLEKGASTTLSSGGFTAIVGSFFTTLAILFYFYDRSVQHRNKVVLANAARAHAVVTNLFPGQFRDQVIIVKEPHDRSKKSTRFGTKSKMKNFLTNGEDQPTDDKPLADLFLNTTVLFADIAGFTSWSSVREPTQVFTLLEKVYGEFDRMAKRRRVFKVETVGDCYVAVVGIPDPRKDHAKLMARFANDILSSFKSIVRNLEVKLGPDTGDLDLRIGMHSGPVTAGVLRGERARFQLFGDTVNVTSRLENSGKAGKIHISLETAKLLSESGRSDWVHPRSDAVEAKGIGIMKTSWLVVPSSKRFDTMSKSSDTSNGVELMDIGLEQRKSRLIAWNTQILLDLVKQIVSRRNASNGKNIPNTPIQFTQASSFLEEVKEIIELPKFDRATAAHDVDVNTVILHDNVEIQLREFVTCVAEMYNNNPFHNFEHASHVTMSVIKLLSRIVAPAEIDSLIENDTEGDNSGAVVPSFLHDHTYGITSDPLTQFACAFSALIHDADHQGVPNTQLVKENAHVAKIYSSRSVAEQNSLGLAWSLFMEDRFADLRHSICLSPDEFKRFRALVVNSVLATDIVDKELKELRNKRWDVAFKRTENSIGSGEDTVEKCNAHDDVNRKATIVIEHLIQASDVSHTMQHWHVYRKWNARLFEELYKAYREGRAEKSPEEFWAKGEIGFFDFYIIPLAKKLADCGVFGVSSEEFLNYALQNRQEWLVKGEAIVAEMMEELRPKYDNQVEAKC